MIETDTRGIDALTGETDANVAMLPTRIWDELVAELGDVPPVPVIDPFDEQPWQQLPTMDELEKLWLVAPAVDIMIAKLALKLHGEGPDLPQFIATQRDLAEMELAWIRETAHAEGRAADLGGPSGPAAVAPAETGGGVTDLQSGLENGVPVGAVRKTRRKKDNRQAPPVQGG